MLFPRKEVLFIFRFVRVSVRIFPLLSSSGAQLLLPFQPPTREHRKKALLLAFLQCVECGLLQPLCETDLSPN